jgi:hypothetical protein
LQPRGITAKNAEEQLSLVFHSSEIKRNLAVTTTLSSVEFIGHFLFARAHGQLPTGSLAL